MSNIRLLAKNAFFCVILITESSFGFVVFGGTYILQHQSVGFYLFAADIVSNFFEEQNAVVMGLAADFKCYLPNSSLNMNTDMAQEVLIQIRDNRENGIFGFNAKMTLDVWNEQGYLNIY